MSVGQFQITYSCVFMELLHFIMCAKRRVVLSCFLVQLFIILCYFNAIRLTVPVDFKVVEMLHVKSYKNCS